MISFEKTMQRLSREKHDGTQVLGGKKMKTLKQMEECGEGIFHHQRKTLNLEQHPELRSIEHNFLLAHHEQHIKSLILKMVQPLIDHSKRNLEHNAKKNERFEILNSKIEALQLQLQTAQADIEEFKLLPEILQICQTKVSENKLAQDQAVSNLQGQIRRLQVKQEEQDTLKKEVDVMFRQRDAEIDQTKLLIKFSEEAVIGRTTLITTEMSQRIQNTLQQVEQCLQELGAQKQFIDSVQSLTLENTANHTKLHQNHRQLETEVNRLKAEDLKSIHGMIKAQDGFCS